MQGQALSVHGKYRCSLTVTAMAREIEADLVAVPTVRVLGPETHMGMQLIVTEFYNSAGNNGLCAHW